MQVVYIVHVLYRFNFELAMATNGEMQIPVRKRAPWHDDASYNVVGSNLGPSKRFFWTKSLLKFTCVKDKIVEDFVLRMIVNYVMYPLSRLEMWQMYSKLNEDLEKPFKFVSLLEHQESSSESFFFQM